ncbi:MAG: DUF86 domain-containing protein [Bacteroidia bacterium]|nr:DUF86 domain-containing protein [Bacteroidia bacterium]
MKDNPSDSLIRLQHIEQAIDRIQKYVADETMISFCENDLVHDAVLFQFTVIGETIINVENNKLEKYEYPWYKVRLFRNLIAHEYFNIKLSAVWQIIKADLPALHDLILTIITNEI